MTPSSGRTGWRPGRRTLLLALYGLALAAAGVVVMISTLPSSSDWPLYRSPDPLTRSIAAMEKGAPPLIEENREIQGLGPFGGVPPKERLDELAETVASGSTDFAKPAEYREANSALRDEKDRSEENLPDWQTINFGAEDGLLIVVPSIAQVFDVSPTGALRLLFVVFFALPLAYYPLVFQRITGSTLVAVLVPLALLLILRLADIGADMYWVQAWAALALLPLVWLLTTRERWGRRAILLLVLIGVAASLASSVRGLSGAPIAIVALIAVALRHEVTRPRRALLGLLVVAAYLSVIPLTTGLTRSYAERWAEDNGGLADAPAPPGNFIWHNAYIGLGYLPNDSGITYSDAVANIKAYTVDNDVYPYTAEYASILRDLYFEEIESDPGHFVGLELKKSAVVLHDHPTQLLLLMLLLPAGLLVPGVRARMWAPVWIVAPTALVGLSQGLLAAPFAHYLFGFSGALLALSLMVFSLFLAELKTLRPQLRSSDSISFRPPLATAIPALALVGVIGASWYAGRATGQNYIDESVEWAVGAPSAAAISRARAFASRDVRAQQDLAYRLGASGPTEELSPALQLNGGFGAVKSSYEPFVNGASRTFEGWALQESAEVGGSLFGGTSLLREPIFWVLAGTENVQLFSANGNVADWQAAWPGAGEWVHWALVFDQSAGEPELFINGESMGSQPQTQPYDDEPGTFQLGAAGLFRNAPFQGRMAGVAVYEQALTPAQIAAHFEGSAKGSYTERVLGDSPSMYWPLDERRGTEIIDESGNGNDGELLWYSP